MNKYIDQGDGTTRIYFCYKKMDHFMLVDTEDVPRMKAVLWHKTQINSRNLTRYGRGDVGRGSVYAHRLVMSFPVEGQIDHLDRNGLNNTKSNLLVVSPTANILNGPHRRGKIDNMPRGIRQRFCTRFISYNARIRICGKLFNLGTYATLGQAVQARDCAEAKALELSREHRLDELLSHLERVSQEYFSHKKRRLRKGL